MDGSGNVYVADKFNTRIQKFDNGGTFLKVWNTGTESFSWVAVDPTGNVFDNNCPSNVVNKFIINTNREISWGGMGSGNGQFNCPLGVAVDTSGNIYVVDAGNARIEKFLACP